ncbi:MAG: hypothetical protein JJT82_00075 [Legionellaceae bacterium]|nr:hypothetical protein [Legionellaceae bacterium]
MSPLQEMMNQLVAIITDYHFRQFNTSNVVPTLAFKSMDNEELFEKLAELIQEIKTQEYSKRMTLLSYILEHVKVIKPQLDDPRLDTPSLTEPLVTQLLNLVISLNTLLITPQKNTITADYNNQTYEIYGCLRAGMFYSDLSQSGTMVKRFLTTFALQDSNSENLKATLTELYQQHHKFVAEQQKLHSELESTKQQLRQAQNKLTQTQSELQKLKTEHEHPKSRTPHPQSATPKPDANEEGSVTLRKIGLFYRTPFLPALGGLTPFALSGWDGFPSLSGQNDSQTDEDHYDTPGNF